MFGRASPGIVRDLSVPQIQQIDLGVNRMVVVVRIIQWRTRHDGPHEIRRYGKSYRDGFAL